MSNVKERPIILTAQEVNAVLAGDKTQHRMILSSQPYTNECGWQVLEIGSVRISDQCATTRPLDEAIKKRLPTTSAAPYRIGDQLWVQEFHARTDRNDHLTRPHYYADGTLRPDLRHDAGLLIKYSAADMPRWASRLLLEITDIRIERVRDIDAASAEVEGCFNFSGYERLKPRPLSAFITYWMAKHGDDAWFTNPWVWVIDFKVIENSEVNTNAK